MDGWETTIETPLGGYTSPPTDDRDAFLALLHVALEEQGGETRTATITHRRDGQEPVVRTVRMERLS